MTLAEATAQIEDEFGAGSLMLLGSRESLDVEAISTGSTGLDEALGVGGVPRGRIVEVYGPESAGKTTLLYHIIANAQAGGDTCAFIDAEHAIDPAYATRIGVNIDNLYLSQPDYGEQGLEIADTLVRSGDVGLIVVDSVAGLTPRAELEGQMGEVQPALLARLMSQAMRKLAGNCNRSGTCVVFTNQLRTNLGMTGYGPNETQPGGRALKFWASQRIDLRRIQTLKQGEEATGIRVRARVVKNKVAPPFRQAEFEIAYGTGINHAAETLDAGLADGSITKKGSWYYRDGEKLGHGREAAKEALDA